MSAARKNVPSWDETFMDMAKVVARRSKDPRTQVGAVIVNNDNRVLTLGYNGSPRGIDDDTMPWASSDDIFEDKHSYVVHAEMNAVFNYRGLLSDFRGATVYVTLFPCHECAKALIQLGVGRIIYLVTRDEDAFKLSAHMFDMAGVNVVQFS